MILKMNKLLWILSLIITIDFQSPVFSIDNSAQARFKTGVGQMDAGDYEKALATFSELIRDFPEHPIGYFGAAGTYQTILRNYRITAFEVRYDSLLDKAVEIGNHAIRRHPEDVLARFYLGGAYGFRGLYKFRKREWLSAFHDGVKGLLNLEESLNLNQELYDAYYGLGIFHYFRSARGNVLGFLNLYPEGKKQGIHEIWLAVRKGFYSEVSGQYALMAIYYDEQEFDKAWKLNERLHARFPDNPSCLYMRSRISEQTGNWKEMLNASQQLLEHLQTAGYGSIGYEIECHYRIALSLYHQGEIDTAKEHLQTALKLNEKREPSKEIEGPLESDDEIMKKIELLYNKIMETEN